jgi:signal transduction histidine kinase
MKIKNKLTLVFTLIIAVLLVCLNLYIYFLSRSNTINSFYNQLKDRAIITLTVILKADEESAIVIKSFQKKYLRTLPDEIVRIYNEKNESVFIDSSATFIFDKRFINIVREKKEYHIEKDNRQIVGIYYEDYHGEIQGNFVIIASAVDETGIHNLNQLKQVLFIGFLLSIVVVFFAGRYFTKLIFNPVTEITKQANQISETNLHLRLNEGNKKDELAELAITINKMLHRLEDAFKIQKDFVANASHELRTPLTSIIGNIEVTLSRQRSSEEYKLVLKTVLAEAEQLHELSDGLLNIAQVSVDINNLKLEDIRIDEVLEEVKDIIHHQTPESKMELSFENMPTDPGDLLIKGNKNLLMIAFENLLENANKFSGNKNVKVTFVYTPEAIVVTINDSGIGIPEKDLSNVLHTFFRAENAHHFSGSGVGLSLSQKIFFLHKGILSIQSELGKGTKVSVLFNKSKRDEEKLF